MTLLSNHWGNQMHTAHFLNDFYDVIRMFHLWVVSGCLEGDTEVGADEVMMVCPCDWATIRWPWEFPIWTMEQPWTTYKRVYISKRVFFTAMCSRLNWNPSIHPPILMILLVIHMLFGQKWLGTLSVGRTSQPIN